MCAHARMRGSAHVVIVWCEDLDGYNPAFFPMCKAHIVVNPLVRLLTSVWSRVRVCVRASQCHTFGRRIWGCFTRSLPIRALRSMRISARLGPSPTRQFWHPNVTFGNSCLTDSHFRFRSYQQPAAFNGRQTKIVAMIDRHSKAQSTAEFYASLFRPLPDDQVAPPIRLTTREVFAAAAKAEQAARVEEITSPTLPISPRPVSAGQPQLVMRCDCLVHTDVRAAVAPAAIVPSAIAAPPAAAAITTLVSPRPEPLVAFSASVMSDVARPRTATPPLPSA